MTLKVCTKCGGEKPLDQFYRTQKSTDANPYYVSPCKDCRKAYAKEQWHDRTPEAKLADGEARRARKLMKNFGITPEEYDEMHERQGGLCLLCRRPETTRHRDGRIRLLAVDHDHGTGEVRGLLCFSCNSKMGYFEYHGLVDRLIMFLNPEARGGLL